MAIDRYHRQRLLSVIGEAGQRKLAESRVLLIGCGALGTVIAEYLVRGGVGFLRIADRDLVELTNLQRQTLFDEADAAAETPKAVAAAGRLGRINSMVAIEPRVVDVVSDNIESLAGDVDLILDGTDNAATRYLVNDVAVKIGKPWVYGACIATEGRVMPIVPGRTPCLRCVFTEPPAAGELPTCDTAGVLGPAAGVVASLQAVEAIKLLVGGGEAVEPAMVSLDVWAGRFQRISLANGRRADCPCCGRREFTFLDRRGDDLTSLCGRDAVQVRPPSGTAFDRVAVEARLAAGIPIDANRHLFRFAVPDRAGVQVTVFNDGRSIVRGVSDFAQARSIVSRYVGG